MRYWEDMDVAETAAVMGCSRAASRRIVRAQRTRWRKP